MTQGQLLKVVPILFGKEITLKDKLYLIKLLSGISWYRWAFVKAAEVMEYLYLLDFLFFEQITLTGNKLPHYRGLYGPEELFKNMRGKEFTFSCAWFDQYNADKTNTEGLNNLVACLYRKKIFGYDPIKNKLGDCRVVFNSNTLPYYARKVKHWPMKYKLLVYAWYLGCHNSLAKLYPKVFTGGGAPSTFGMWSVMRSIARDSIHGDFTKVENMYVQEMMMEITESVIEADKLKQKQKTP